MVPDEVLSRFLRQWRITSNSLRHAHGAIRAVSLHAVPMLDIDGLPILVHDPSHRDTPEKALSEAEEWLLRAALVDMLIGMNESLIEGCRIMHIYTAAKESLVQPVASTERFAANVDAKEEKLMTMHLPGLVKELEATVGAPMHYSDEVLSINQLRRCIVHRNGFVTRKDLTSEAETVLRLKYLQQKVTARENGVVHDVDRAFKARSPLITELSAEPVRAHIDFKLGVPILLSTDLLNDAAYTCIQFLQALRLRIYTAIGVEPKEPWPLITLTKG